MRTAARRRAGALALALLAGCGAAGRPGPGDAPRPGALGGPPAAAVAGRGVEGRVVDERGQPVADALIEARSLEQPPRPLPQLGVLSGSDGRFRWPLPPGRHALRARLGETLSCEVAVPEAAGALTLTLGRAPSGGCPPLPGPR